MLFVLWQLIQVVGKQDKKSIWKAMFNLEKVIGCTKGWTHFTPPILLGLHTQSHQFNFSIWQPYIYCFACLYVCLRCTEWKRNTYLVWNLKESITFLTSPWSDIQNFPSLIDFWGNKPKLRGFQGSVVKCTFSLLHTLTSLSLSHILPTSLYCFSVCLLVTLFFHYCEHF